MKKLLLITFLLSFTFSFGQQSENRNVVASNDVHQKTILTISASPNPFNVQTKINFISTKVQMVEFSVKNLLGKTVYLEKLETKIGNNSIPFYRNNLTKGMYIYCIQSDTEIISKRLIIR
ncbi:T9SS type A sorting domain-containing protein [Lutibacter sp.]